MDSYFDMRLHCGGKMHLDAMIQYVGGQVIVTREDSDKLSWLELKSILCELGYKEPENAWFKVPNLILSQGLTKMVSDDDILKMAALGVKHGTIDVYIESSKILVDEYTDYASDEDYLFSPLQQSDSEFSEDLHAEADDFDEEYLLAKVNRMSLGADEESDPTDDEVLTPRTSEDEGGCHHPRARYIFNPKHDYNDVEFKVGMFFESSDQFKEAMHQYSIIKGYPIRWARSTKLRKEAKCAENCSWRIYGSWSEVESAFIVKSYNEEHSCARPSRNKMASAQWLANHYLRKFRFNPNWSVTEMMRDMQEKFALTVTKTTCYRARAVASEMILGSLKDQYNMLPSYIGELKKVYKNSTFELLLHRSSPQELGMFKRLYICFESLCNGFSRGCRPVIGLDGCFLKTHMGGQLLSAVAQDGNDQMFPIAWAVVEGENEGSWTWFLELLMQDLRMATGYGLTVISDQQKGLENAVRRLWPDAEHRNCARHIYANWKKKHNGFVLKNLFWKAVRSTTEVSYNDALNEMKVNSVMAYDDFVKVGAQKFCKLFISTWPKCDVINNNVSECFNSYILKARAKPLIDMLEDIRSVIMERMAEKKELMLNATDDLCPKVRKRLEKNKLSSRNCFPRHAGDMNFQVDEVPNRFTVNLVDKSCSCRMWNLTGIPCGHAISCINWMKRNPDDYVDELLKKEMYLKTYEQLFPPLNGPRMWLKVAEQRILPPEIKKQPGRPKKARKRDKDEEEHNSKKRSKKGLEQQCKLCKKYGHNMRTCNLKGQTECVTMSATVKKRGRPRKIIPETQQVCKGPGQQQGRSSTNLCSRIESTSNEQLIPEIRENTSGTFPNQIVHQEQTGPSKRPKLSVKRNAAKAATTTTESNKSTEMIFHRDMNLMRSGCGIIVSDSGTTFYKMPEEPIRTSYMGRLGGQFTNAGQTSSQNLQRRQAHENNATAMTPTYSVLKSSNILQEK